MSFTLQTGLDDTSAVLNESNTITTTARKTHYNEAVIEFCRSYKWPFLIKSSTDLTEANVAYYPLPSDIREPGGLLEVLVDGGEFDPIEFSQRADVTDGDCYYLDPDTTNRKIYLIPTPTTAGLTITFRHYFTPTRITDTTSSFSLPDFVRRPIALLTAEYVSRAKRQHATANNLRQLYNQAREEVLLMQSERTSKLPHKFGFFTKLYSYRRTHRT